MAHGVAAAIDFVHAVLMVAWIAGVPLLFVRRWPRVTRAYTYYALVFIVVSQVSHFVLGECFLTTIARHFWQAGAAHAEAAPHTWFVVRFAELVFRARPTERSIVVAWEVLVAICCVGFLIQLRRARRA